MTIDEDANVRAFLAMIRDAEGTSSQPDPYRVCYGYSHVIEDTSDHPANTGEWDGSEELGSDAAGAYQFMSATWNDLKKAGKVWDFSPESQDAGAIALIERRHALGYVRAGQLAKALERCSYEWASLPPSRYGQPIRDTSFVVASFTANGGTPA